jgi:hypothetical protein
MLTGPCKPPDLCPERMCALDRRRRSVAMHAHAPSRSCSEGWIWETYGWLHWPLDARSCRRFGGGVQWIGHSVKVPESPAARRLRLDAVCRDEWTASDQPDVPLRTITFSATFRFPKHRRATTHQLSGTRIVEIAKGVLGQCIPARWPAAPIARRCKMPEKASSASELIPL